MKKLSIYLDTSIINFLFADDAPEMMAATLDFFDNYVKTKVYDVYISQVVIDEIRRTINQVKKENLINVIDQYKLEVIDWESIVDEVVDLAEVYINERVIPESKMEDALHIAIATIEEIDVLLSWNFRHLANVNKEAKINAINHMRGHYKSLKMITPFEVISDEQN